MKENYEKIIKLFVGTLFLLTMTVDAEPKCFVAPAVENAPDLMKGLDDPAWNKALKFPFTKFNIKPGHTVKYPTESYWLYAGGALYVGFKCVNPDSPELWLSSKQPRDSSLVFNHESVELFIGDFKGDLYYQIAIDALGNLFDGKRYNGNWDGPQKYNVDIQKGYWTLIIEIPPEMLSTIWSPGSCITLDITRHAYNPDGTGGEITTLSPPGVHSPEDQLFLGDINPAYLGKLLSSEIAMFKNSFADVTLTDSVAADLKKIDDFAIRCEKAGNVSLKEYRELYNQYQVNGKCLTNLKKDVILGLILKKDESASEDSDCSMPKSYLNMLDKYPYGNSWPPEYTDYECVEYTGSGIPEGLDVMWMRGLEKNEMPREKGFAFLWHDKEFLHVCAVMEDSDPFNTAKLKNDAPHVHGDVLELFFQPAGDTYFELHIAPNLATLEYCFPKDGCFQDNSLGHVFFFDSGMKCEVGNFSLPSGVSGWWGHMKIPFANIKSSANKLKDAKFTVSRFNYNTEWGKKWVDKETSAIGIILGGKWPMHNSNQWLKFKKN